MLLQLESVYIMYILCELVNERLLDSHIDVKL